MAPLTGDDVGTMSTSAVRGQVRRWVSEHWDPDRSLVEWRGLLVDSGWAVPSWPSAWHGKGLPHGRTRPRHQKSWLRVPSACRLVSVPPSPERRFSPTALTPSGPGSPGRS